MEHSINTAIILLLLFFAITFLQSGYDKITDWKGNIGWLKGHFANTPIKNMVPASLMLILILEVVSGGFSLVAVIKVLMHDGKALAYYSGVLSALTLLFLLLGQRLAKDYDGARTIVIYFIPAILLLIIC